jgi:endonuclease-8
VPQLAATDLAGRTVQEVRARGKHMLTRFTDGWTLRTHYRMDGSWHIYRHGARWRGGPAFAVRAILENPDWVCVGYRLHDVVLVRTADEDQVVGHLGPDVLDPDFDLDEALRRLRSHPDEQIGAAILDQRNLCGPGNLYKVEGLFVCGVHPWARVADVEDLPALVERIRGLMLANRDRPEQSTTGDLRRGRDHWVYGRKDRPCYRCGTPVLRGDQGPDTQERITYWCPRCQAARSPIDPRARTGEPDHPPPLVTST